MSEFRDRINQLKYRVECYNKNVIDLKAMQDSLDELNKRYSYMLEAQSLLGTVADENTQAVLSFITGIINKVLSDLFPYDGREVTLEKILHGGQYPHIKAMLKTSSGDTRDLQLQCGTGLRQVVSFLFCICLIEVRKTRKIFIMDEVLSGLHKQAKGVILEIMKIFAKGGFQFIVVEYGISPSSSSYIVEKPSNDATISAIGKEDDVTQAFIFNRPPEDVNMAVAYES